MTHGPKRFRLSRRGLVAGLGASAIVSPGASAQWRRNREQTLSYLPPEPPLDRNLGLSPTPACAAGHAEATERQTEGPFYTPNTPLRDDLAAGVEGPPLIVIGRVLTPDCRPLAGAVLDFWQADATGEYDNEGFRLRGHQFTDASGGFRLSTIRPGGYGAGRGARVPHIHVKVQGRGTGLLTTQLYFPDADNADDRIYRDDLLMTLSQTDGVIVGRFDFVLQA